MKKHLFLLLNLFVSHFALGQNDIVSLDFNTPHATVYAHLYYLQSDTYAPEKAKLALYDNPKNGTQLAIQLKQIFDGKGLFVELGTVPMDSSYVDSLAQTNIYRPFPKELPDIYLQKYGNKWYYSATTIEAIPKWHRKVYPFGADTVVNLFPKFGQQDFLGLKLWQWIGAVLLIFFALVIYKLMTFIIRPILKKILQSRFQTVIPDGDLLWEIAKLISVLIVFWFLIIEVAVLQLPIELAKAIRSGLQIVQTIFLIFLLLRLVDLMIYYFKKITDKTESTLDDQLLPIVRTSLNAIVIVGSVIHILTLLNVNVTALIAGVSIGGLALALAAQDTVKNLIGSIMIFADKPFQIGDFIKVKDVVGTVEVVGFRSTRVRTPDNSVVAIPNGTLANEIVNNMGMRIYRRFNINIGVTYQTSPDQIEQFVEGIRGILMRHSKTKKDNFEVHFNNLNNSSLDIYLNAYLDVPTWSEELKVKQELLLAIMRLANLLAISFAFPSTSIYMEQPKSNDMTTGTAYQTMDELLADLEKKWQSEIPKA